MSMLAWIGMTVGIIVYAGVAGFWGTAFYRDSKCDGRCYHPHGFTSASIGASWPLSIPVLMCGALAWRDQNKAADDLAEAKHRADLAEQVAREEEAMERRYRALARGIGERP